MAVEWETHKLGDCCDINPSSIRANWPYRSMKYIDISSVGEGIATTPPTRYQRTDAPSRAQRLVAPGDSLLSTVRPNRRSMLWLGNVDDDVVVSTGFAVLRARPGVIEPRFLYYTIFDQWFTEYLITREKGAAYPAVSTTDIADAKILLPPLAEQRAIAGVLGALDDKIELNRRMNATLESMARALFQSWFVDFDPVRAKLDGRKPVGMDEETADLFPDSFQDSEAGHIPKGWTSQRLPDAIEVNPRRVLKSGTIAPYLDMKNLPAEGHSAEEVIDREFTSGTKFQNGDTLLARITPCLENGKTGYVDFLSDGQVGWGSTEYIVLSPKPPLPPQFGYLLARSDTLRTHAIQNMTGTSGRQRVPSECFNTFWLAVPTPEIARRFDEITGSLMAKIKTNATESRTLATLRDTLLPKLLSGELSVAEASRNADITG